MAHPNGIKTAESHNGLCAISVNVQSQLTFSMTSFNNVVAWEHGAMVKGTGSGAR